MKISRNRARLIVGWIVGITFLVVARPTATHLAAGIALALLGAAVRAWAAGTIHKNRELTTSGPYAFTRNPLYLGSFLIGLGLAIASGWWVLLAAYVVLFGVIYGHTMRIEAARLERQFGELYRDYSARVPLFLPQLKRYPHASGAGFRFERYLRNREQDAAVGILLGFLVLLLKMALL